MRKFNNDIIYELKRGETLDSVCSEFRVNLSHVQKINNIKAASFGNFVYFDKVNLKMHIVGPKETIATIAEKYNISEIELIRENDIKAIFIGEQLIIP